MRQSLKIWNIIFTAFLMGVLPMKATAQSDIPQWIHVKDSSEHIEASFPHQPTQMNFDIPLENTKQLGALNVYSAPLGQELWMLCTLSSPDFKGNELEKGKFQEVLYTYIFQRMFYQPKIFKEEAKFSQKSVQFENNPALSFSIHYQDHGIDHQLAGVAITKENKLYILFYLANSDNFKETMLQKFLHSFHFIP